MFGEPRQCVCSQIAAAAGASRAMKETFSPSSSVFPTDAPKKQKWPTQIILRWCCLAVLLIYISRRGATQNKDSWAAAAECELIFISFVEQML